MMAAAATQNDIKAKLMADILNIELSSLSFPSPLTARRRSELISQLHDTPPARSALAFQTADYEGAARSAMSQVISDDEKKSLFCMVHGEFVTKSGVDVEHAIAHSHIRANQIALLSLLNRDHALRDALLLQANMHQFFQIDSEDSLVKGTGYFYQICYNDTENLWLLCHSCNIHKGGGDPLLWFKKQEPYFGAAFAAAIESEGGLHAGIILDRIFAASPDDPRVEYEDAQYILHAGESKGLGLFVREWFFTHHREQFEAHHQFYTKNYAELKKELLAIHISRENGTTSEKEYALLHDRLKQNLVELEAIQIGMNALNKELSSSDSETKSEASEGIANVAAAAVNQKRTQHELKNIRGLLKHTGGFSKPDYKVIFQDLDLSALTPDEIKAVRSGLTAFVTESPKTAAEVKAKLQELYRMYRSVPGAESAAIAAGAEADRRAREAAELRAEAETTRAEAEATRAEAEATRAKSERKAREAAELKAQELEAELARERAKKQPAENPRPFAEAAEAATAAKVPRTEEGGYDARRQ